MSQISHQNAPNSDIRMGLTLQDALVRALKKLEETSFQRFIEKLSVWEVREEYKKILKYQLIDEDPEHVAGLINEYYTYAYGAEVTLAVLKGIGEKKVWEELQHDLREVDIAGHGLGTAAFTENVHFIDHHQLDLIRRITDVDSALHDLRDQNQLNPEQYNKVMEKRTTQEKMKHLCDIIRHWEESAKHMAYKVLRKYNEKLIKDLLEKDKRQPGPWLYDWDGDSFIDRNEHDLIKVISNVNPVIDDLHYNHLLTREERNHFMQITDSEDMMRHLYDKIRKWKAFEKVKVYHSLYKHNSSRIDDLKMEDSLKLGSYSEFLKKHHLDLISRLIIVDPILDDLWDQGFLKQKQYDLLHRQPDIKKKITELLHIVRSWGVYSKSVFFKAMCAHNPSIITDLQRAEGKETTGPCTYIQGLRKPSNISKLKKGTRVASHSHGSVTDIHSGGSYTNLGTKLGGTRVASHSHRSCSDTYSCISDINLEFELEGGFLSEGRQQTSTPAYSNDNPSSTIVDIKLLGGRKHFVDEHCWDLIRRIIMVDPVLDDLLEQNLLLQEQYNALSNLETPQKKMIELYDTVRSWTNVNKDLVYLSLRQHNQPFIRVLEKSDQKLKFGNSKKGSRFQKLTLDLETGFSAGKHFLDKHKSGLINVIKSVNPVVEDLKEEGLLSEEQYHNILLKETPKEKMAEIYKISDSFDNKNKDKVYLSIRKHNSQHIRVLERISRPSLSVSQYSGDVAESVESVYNQVDNQNTWVAPGSIQFTITCSICMEMYTDPVTLICGHNYCLGCIERTWNNQDEDDTCCPICRRRFKNRPELSKNLVLCQIVEFCQSTKSAKKTNEHCTYCTSVTPKPAVKWCMLCEAFLCEDHLEVHSKQAEHVILEPSASLEYRRCPIHRRVLEYYCSQDSACVCAHCCIVGEHKGHHIMPFIEAMEIKKDELRDTEENVNLKKLETEKYIKICRQKEPGADGAEAQEMGEILKLVPEGLSLEGGQAASTAEGLIRHLEAKRSHLIQIIAHIKELCLETDALLVLQDHEDYNL